MGEKPDKNKLTAEQVQAFDQLLDIIASNVRGLMEAHVEGTNKPVALGLRAKVGKGSVQRVLAGSKGYAGQAKSDPQIGTLFKLAWYFNVPLVSLMKRNDRASIVLDPGVSAPLELPPRDLKSRRG